MTLEPRTASSILFSQLGGSEEEGNGVDITEVVKGMEGVDVMDARKKHREKGRKEI